MPGHQDVFFQSSGVALALRVTRRRRGAINDAALGQFGIAVRQVVADIEQQYVATGVGKGQSRSAAGQLPEPMIRIGTWRRVGVTGDSL